MSKLINITQLSAQIGLSVTTIRRRVANGSLPAVRANTATQAGKYLFDIDLVQQLLRNEALSNLRNCEMDAPAPEPAPEQTSYLAGLFQPSEDAADAEAERDALFGYKKNNARKDGSLSI